MDAGAAPQAAGAGPSASEDPTTDQDAGPRRGAACKVKIWLESKTLFLTSCAPPAEKLLLQPACEA